MSADAIRTAALQWFAVHAELGAASVEKLRSGSEYRLDPHAIASGALTRHADACRQVTSLRRRERAALIALAKACAAESRSAT